MNRKLQFMAFLSGFFLCIGLTSQASHAQETAGEEFGINAEGTVKAGDATKGRSPERSEGLPLQRLVRIYYDLIQTYCY